MIATVILLIAGLLTPRSPATLEEDRVGPRSRAGRAASWTMRYTFDDVVLDTTRYELRRGGELVHVEPQVFDVLTTWSSTATGGGEGRAA